MPALETLSARLQDLICLLLGLKVVRLLVLAAAVLLVVVSCCPTVRVGGSGIVCRGCSSCIRIGAVANVEWDHLVSLFSLKILQDDVAVVLSSTRITAVQMIQTAIVRRRFASGNPVALDESQNTCERMQQTVA